MLSCMDLANPTTSLVIVFSSLLTHDFSLFISGVEGNGLLVLTAETAKVLTEPAALELTTLRPLDEDNIGDRQLLLELQRFKYLYILGTIVQYYIEKFCLVEIT